jgi:hypothetical protein
MRDEKDSTEESSNKNRRTAGCFLICGAAIYRQLRKGASTINKRIGSVKIKSKKMKECTFSWWGTIRIYCPDFRWRQTSEIDVERERERERELRVLSFTN